MESKNINHTELNIENLVANLKNKDTNYSKLSRRIQITYLILTFIYAALIVLELIEKFSIYSLLGGLCYLGSFLILIVVFGRFYKEYGQVNYSETTLIMLKKAADRYKPFKKITFWVLFSLALMDVGMCLNKSLNFPIIKTQFYYWGMIIIAVGIGLIVWYYRYKPLLDATQKLIKEIEE